jgi:aspartyl-tRNA(Asn)/glutamyl-tRNA(Gln) amidotransferase subunit C
MRSRQSFVTLSQKCYNLPARITHHASRITEHGALRMPLTTAEVEHIAELARLSLTDQEKTLFREQLSSILDYAAAIQQVDTSTIPPTATVLPLRNVMRDDIVAPSMPREDVLANAPDAAEGCFRVRAILEA